MKILNPGKVEQRKFVCPNCECEFVIGEYEETVYWDDDDCIATCPVCRERLLWCDGEPYEELTPTQTDRDRLRSLTYEWECDHASICGLEDFLIAHGVTFREG